MFISSLIKKTVIAKKRGVFIFYNFFEFIWFEVSIVGNCLFADVVDEDEDDDNDDDDESVDDKTLLMLPIQLAFAFLNSNNKVLRSVIRRMRANLSFMLFV